jgi:hypothetical protein
MKSPDDTVACFARLRRLIVDSFVADDFATWTAATEEARRLLRPTPSRHSEAMLKVWARRRAAKEEPDG